MNKRVVVLGAGGIGAGVAAALMQAGARVVEPVSIEQAKRTERAYVESGGRLRNTDFKDRIAAMQMRGTIQTCIKNARREYNRLQRKQLDAMLDEMMPKASDFL